MMLSRAHEMTSRRSRAYEIYLVRTRSYLVRTRYVPCTFAGSVGPRRDMEREKNYLVRTRYISCARHSFWCARDRDSFSCARDISRAHEMLCRAHEMLSRAHEIIFFSLHVPSRAPYVTLVTQKIVVDRPL